jgi:hypothetical protein
MLVLECRIGLEDNASSATPVVLTFTSCTGSSDTVVARASSIHSSGTFWIESLAMLSWVSEGLNDIPVPTEMVIWCIIGLIQWCYER